MVKRDKEKYNQYMREYRQKHLEEIREQDRVRCVKRRGTKEYKNYHIDYHIKKGGNPKIAGYFLECEQCGEVIKKSIERITKVKHNFCNKKCAYEFREGKEPWNKGIVTRPISERPYRESRWGADYAEWHNECLRRDWYHCQLCSSKERLEVHHIKSYKDYPQERLLGST